MASKKELRKAMNSRLQQLTVVEKKAKSAAVCQKILQLPAYKNAKRLMAFLNMTEEISLDALMTEAIAAGKEVYVPLCLNKTQMEAVRLPSVAEAVTGMYGIRTAPAGSPKLAPEKLDLVLVPGLAFDRQGHRLGHGAAYYDRFLGRCPKAAAVAVAFHEQVVPAVPVDAHDVSMHALVTDEEKIIF